MDSVTWQNRKRDKGASVEAPTKFLLVTCRSLSSSEQKILSKNFKNIHLYNAALSSDNMDLTALTFDLLIVDASKRENYLFLEVVGGQCAALNIPIIVLKRRFTNSKDLALQLDAYVIDELADLTGPNFFRSLTKDKLVRLQSRIWTLLKKLFMLFVK